MLFAPVTASVVEFAHQPHVDRLFAYMAGALGLDYHLLPAIATHSLNTYGATPGNVEALSALVTQILAAKGWTKDVTHDEL